MKDKPLALHPVAMLVLVLLGLTCGHAEPAQTPSSMEAAGIDIPILRVPKTSRPPTLDGVMEDGEWADASAISNFWYDFLSGHFYYLAPKETQLQIYAMYDDSTLYIAYRSPVYPEDTWLKARGRFPNVLSHPMYGILWDDKIELELRPYHDAAVGYQMGLFRWTINSVGVSDEALWSPATGWEHKAAKMRIGSKVSPTYWFLELAVPFEAFARGPYAGRQEDGTPIVQIPPPDGSIWRCWFSRGIGGTGTFFNANDAHMWNTTKMQLVFDSRAVGFQVNELGPILEDVIDLHVTVKNHNNRSEAVQLGFFVESAEGNIYSSYEDDELTDGVLELIPGETRKIRLRKLFPGITTAGNTLWFDVRSAGAPAKVLYRTRLANFHSKDIVFDRGRDDDDNPVKQSFREWRIDAIEELRPPRKDFEVYYNFWPYDNNVALIVDRGLIGASEESQRATEVRVAAIEIGTSEEIAKATFPFNGDFAVGEFKLPTLKDDTDYKLTVLLFDENKRIVGDQDTGTFNKWALPGWMLDENIPLRVKRKGGTFTPIEKWWQNEVGLSDTVWEPFTPIEQRADGFETLNHVFVLGPTGLPSQIYIKPENRVLPLEMQDQDISFADERLVAYGRGPQLRSPVRLEVEIDGQRHTAEAVEPATLVRKWKSEFEYHSRVKIGPVEADLAIQYDCDGSYNVVIKYGTQQPTIVKRFEMVTEVAGAVDMLANAMREGGMAGSDQWECSLPNYEGIIWDSSTLPKLPMFYSYFVPWMYFGNGDRGFSYFSDSDRGWGLDKDGSAMTLERNADGQVTWRVIFINHSFDVQGSREIDFTILTHPAKPKPANFRDLAWHYTGPTMIGYQDHPADMSEEALKRDWHRAARAPSNIPWEEAKNWRKDDPPWTRYGRWRNAGGSEPYHAISPALDRTFEQKCVYLYERQIRVGRRHGWWWDEYWPSGFSGSQNIAAGLAYFRDPEMVAEDEIPWQSGWTTGVLRRTHKRLARSFQESNVPQRQHNWSNNQANMIESYGWDTWLVEECGSDHRSAEIDVVAAFPMSIYRYMSKHFLGTPARVVPGAVGAIPGDENHLDRQHLGLGLLNDIGVSPSGPHGNFRNVDQAIRLLGILTEFGYFEKEKVEYIPYWRNQQIIRYGEGRKRVAPTLDLSKAEPQEQVYISIYRRPHEQDGRKGYKALIVIMNCFRKDARLDLRILQPEKLFGGPNTLTLGEALKGYAAECNAAPDLLAQWGTHNADTPVLLDLEKRTVLERVSYNDGDNYGAVYVPRHDYRIFYGHYLADMTDSGDDR